MSVSDLNEEKNNIVACIRRSFSRRDILMEWIWKLRGVWGGWIKSR